MNPLLSKLKMPGRIFQLPSLGLFYDDGMFEHPLHNGEITVTSLTALDEMTLKNPDYVFSGKGLLSVISNCVEGIKQPEKLLMKDIDAILAFIRIVSFGSEYTIDDYQHDCKDAIKHSYVVNIEQQFLSNIKYIKDINDYTVNINDFTVEIKPIIFEDWLDTIHNSNSYNIEDVKKLTDMFFDLIIYNIKSVDGISDREMIKEWLTKLPKKSFKELEDEISKRATSFGITTELAFMCKDCEKNVKIELQLNPTDFLLE